MSTASFDNIQPSAGGTARNAVRGIAAAWANLNGTGTIALRDSENVSSVVDNGTGDYSFNYTNNFATIEDRAITSAKRHAASTNNASINHAVPTAVSSNRLITIEGTSPVPTDTNYVCFSAYGDLA